METRDPDTAGPAEEAPPGWVLNTPTRPLEVWTYPVLVLLLAAAHVGFGIAFGGALALVVGVSAAVVTTVGAVALFVTGRRAYVEQTRGASWRSHVTRVVVAVVSVGIVSVTTLTVGFPFGALFGAIAGVPTAFRFARSVPRIDRLVVAWTALAVAVWCGVLAILGLTLADLPDYRSTTWTFGAAFAVISAVMAVHQFVVARRSPHD
ncbi:MULTISPECIES: hypothetical protein [unclassified Curtobacterium]|uniref:hypothetical protein n=1 Tax=unclassified Curtobacterium TaxID=257496 RepID=UPI000DA74205|nr:MULTISPECIES: hypothetical protein [unclassified Curtobacterium]PZE72260.1 hypothetical protein DEJ12_00990 [Curtobacterium sp. MCLR17_059]PZF46050.1 hypothetical protein DEJ10_16980 [Curtobacterium sp. MCLR17_057]